jgi:metallo-beta-lactamase class B
VRRALLFAAGWFAAGVLALGSPVLAGQMPLDPATSAALRDRMQKERDNDELQALVQPFKVFDNLYYVGDGGVSSWVITTRDGLVLLDANRDPVVQRVVERIRQLGLDPSKIKLMLVGEGHQDHSGGAAYVQEHFGARVAMLAEDWELAAGSAAPPDARRPRRDMVVKGGDSITVGETTFKFYHLPGHTHGGLSIEFTVHDAGRPRKAFSFAGSGNRPGVPMDLLEKLVVSTRQVERMTGVEVNVQNHPWLMGNVLEKGERLARRRPGEPHPFVEPEAFRKWTTDIRVTAEKQLESAKAAAGQPSRPAGSR